MNFNITDMQEIHTFILKFKIGCISVIDMNGTDCIFFTFWWLKVMNCASLYLCISRCSKIINNLATHIHICFLSLFHLIKHKIPCITSTSSISKVRAILFVSYYWCSNWQLNTSTNVTWVITVKPIMSHLKLL